MVTVSIEFILGIIFILFILLCAICYSVFKYVKQFFCKHESFRETRSCDAICNNCNKDLGFIGRVREERDKGQL